MTEVHSAWLRQSDRLCIGAKRVAVDFERQLQPFAIRCEAFVRSALKVAVSAGRLQTRAPELGSDVLGSDLLSRRWCGASLQGVGSQKRHARLQRIRRHPGLNLLHR